MSSVYSDRWHRVAGLRPRLAPQVRVRRQQQRGQAWMLLADPVTGRSCRLSRPAYELAARLDGERTVQGLWDAQAARPGDAPTQDEVVELLARLNEQGLLLGGPVAGAAGDATAHRRDDESPGRARPRSTLLAWRVPLGDPSRWLDRLAPLQRLLFSRPAALLALLALAWAGLTAAEQASALWAYGERWAATPRLALLALLLYPPIKLVHEAAHGLVARRVGAGVHDAGLTLMLGLPVPYVDASSASSLPGRGARIAVGAAGIAAELAIAALALAAWVAVPDGLAREAAFAALGIAGVSTLFFNGNPLQRLDGYYIACDALDLPNLGPRSREYWLDLLRRRLLRVPGAEPMALARGERPWLLAYAPLSWAWGLGVAALALAWLAALSAVLGALAAAVLALQLLLRPAWTLATELGRQARPYQGAAGRLRRAGAVLAGLALAALALPLPRATTAPGLLWPADDAQIRAETEGFVQAVHRHDGDAVAAGELVLELANPRLQAEAERLGARIASLEAQMFDAGTQDGERSANLRAELQAAQLALAQLQGRLAALQVRTRSAGRLALPEGDDLVDQFARQGRLLGHVVTGRDATVRVAVPEDEAGPLRERLRGASVRLAERGAAPQPATLRNQSAGAVSQLPSAALSDSAGGDVVTDPQDSEHLRTLRPVVLIDLTLDGDAPAERLGTRAWVRFDQGWAPLAWQWLGDSARRWWRRANPQR